MRLAEIVLRFQSCTLLSRVMVPVTQVRCIWPTWGFSCTQNTEHPLWPVQNTCPCCGPQREVRDDLSGVLSPVKYVPYSVHFCQRVENVQSDPEGAGGYQCCQTDASSLCSLRLTAAVFAFVSVQKLPSSACVSHPSSSLCSSATLQCRHGNNLRPPDQLT